MSLQNYHQKWDRYVTFSIYLYYCGEYRKKKRVRIGGSTTNTVSLVKEAISVNALVAAISLITPLVMSKDNLKMHQNSRFIYFARKSIVIW